MKLKDRSGSDTGPWRRNARVDFRGAPRTNTRTRRPRSRGVAGPKSNDTAARLCFAGHLLIKNRNPLIFDIALTPPTATPSGRPPSTCPRDCLAASAGGRWPPKAPRHRELGGRLPQPGRHLARRAEHHEPTRRHRRAHHPPRRPPHQSTSRCPDRRTVRWIRTVTGGRKLRFRGRHRNRVSFLLAGAIYTSSASLPWTPDRHSAPRRRGARSQRLGRADRGTGRPAAASRAVAPPVLTAVDLEARVSPSSAPC